MGRGPKRAKRLLRQSYQGEDVWPLARVLQSWRAGPIASMESVAGIWVAGQDLRRQFQRSREAIDPGEDLEAAVMEAQARQQITGAQVAEWMRPPWPDVIERLGADGMRVLMGCSVFVPTQNASLAQVSGPSFARRPAKRPRLQPPPSRVAETDLMAGLLYATDWSRMWRLPRISLSALPGGDSTQVTTLIRRIFQLDARPVPRSYRALPKLLQQFAHGYQQIPFGACMQHAYQSSFPTISTPSASTTTMHKLLSHYVPPSVAAAFAYDILQRSMPPALLGSAHNHQALRVALQRLCTAGRGEQPSLSDLLRGFRLRDMAWAHSGRRRSAVLNNRSQHMAAQRKLACLVQFLLHDVSVPVLRAAFYVTESGSYGTTLFYYPRPVWRRLEQEAWTALSRRYEAIPREPAPAAVGALRFVPKASGSLRPIVNLSAGGRDSANRQLQPLLAVLSYELARKPHLRGCGIGSLAEAHQHLLAHSSNKHDEFRGSVPQVVALDLQDAFGSIPAARLLQLLSDGTVDLLSEAAYVVRRVARSDVPGRVVWDRVVVPVGQHRSTAALQTARSLVSDAGHGVRLTRDDALALLRRHLCDSAVRYRGALWRPRHGLPQGSVLSPLLCNLYYGHVENTDSALLALRRRGCLLRMVDDYVYVTRDSAAAAELVRVFHGGALLEWQVRVQAAKTCASVGIPPHVPGGSQAVPWCGVELTVGGDGCLGVRADYRRYDGLPMTAAIAHPRSAGVLAALRRRMQAYIANKMLPLLLDPALNPPRAAATSFHDILRLAALKLRAHLRKGEALGMRPLPLHRLCALLDGATAYAARRYRAAATPRPNLSALELRALAYRAFADAWRFESTGSRQITLQRVLRARARSAEWALCLQSRALLYFAVRNSSSYLQNPIF